MQVLRISRYAARPAVPMSYLRSIGVIVRGHEEKETDVTIAVKMFELAQSGTDTIVVVSGDTDLRAAVDGVRRCYPSVRVHVAFPPHRVNKDLRRRADWNVPALD